MIDEYSNLLQSIQIIFTSIIKDIYMPKEILYLLVLVLLIANTSAAPAEDEVKFPISGYNDHKWYSGMPLDI